MKMFFDVSGLDQKNLTGIGVYTKYLFQNLKRISDSSIYPICSASRWRHKETIESHTGSKVSSSLIVPHLPFELKLFHSPDHRQVSDSAHIRVQTIHDVAMLEDEDYSERSFQRKFRKRFHEILSDPKVDQFITVSHFSKSRILHFYPHLRGRVKVVYSGSNHMQVAENQARVFPWPYLLSVGTLEKRKNVLGLLKSFLLIAPKYTDLRLVLIGKEGYGSEQILEAIDQHPYKDRIVLKNFTSDTLLANAYRFAEMLIYPSLYEGFGLPVLEAMRSRCPVVCSNIPSLVEIGGEAVRTFSPNDHIEMAEVIETVYLDPSERYLLKNLGVYNSQKYNWQLTAKKTWDVYMELLRDRLNEGLPSEQWESALLGGN